MEKLVLEPSTNTHTLKAEKISSKEIDSDVLRGVIKITTNGDAIVTHGEHGTIKTESEHVIKYVQQELNPVTKKMQNAFD